MTVKERMTAKLSVARRARGSTLPPAPHRVGPRPTKVKLSVARRARGSTLPPAPHRVGPMTTKVKL
jgi:hypothetical protein